MISICMNDRQHVITITITITINSTHYYVIMYEQEGSICISGNQYVLKLFFLLLLFFFHHSKIIIIVFF